jgi:alginate O-acetyltransferase complex protein AlgI
VIFTEFRFLFFFAAVFCVYWALKRDVWRKWLLLIASYVFYGAWDPRFLILIAASTLLDYGVGIGLDATTDSRRRRWLITASLLGNLGLLGFFKYWNFFVDSGARVLGWLGLPCEPATLDIILPVGISFYTFQTLSYALDVYRRDLKATRSLLDFSLFVAFFPQLVAGPIVRASDFLPQLDAPRRWAWVPVRKSLVLFMIGFVKKSVVSDFVSQYVDAYFKAPGNYGVGSAWTAVLLYAAQIYCDFSGYSDMAIASAGLLGYNLCENFRFPYFSKSLTEFWSRWHMSLTTWMRDYLYFPLGGGRGSEWATWRNVWITWLVSGLWHGAAWHFVLSLGIMPPALLLHRAWSRRGLSMPDWLGTVLTFVYICIAFTFLRARDVPQAVEVLRALFAFDTQGTAVLGDRLPLVFAGLSLVHWISYKRLFAGVWERVPRLVFAGAYGALAAFALALSSPQAQPFVYFQF